MPVRRFAIRKRWLTSSTSMPHSTGSHHIGRRLAALGHDVRLIPAAFDGGIRPFRARRLGRRSRTRCRWRSGAAGRMVRSVRAARSRRSSWPGAPQLARVAILFNPNMDEFAAYRQTAEADAHSLAIELVPCPAKNAAEIERSIASFAQAPNGGLLYLRALQPYCIVTSLSNPPPDTGCRPSTKPGSGSQLGG